MKTIIPYFGFNEIRFNTSYKAVCEYLKSQKIKYNTERWANKGCTPEVPWDIIRIGNTVSLFFAKGAMFKMYFENDFDGCLNNGIRIGMPIDEARMIDSSIRYDDWEEEYVSDNGYWLEDDPETHSIISISIFIKEVEDDNAFYSYQWCEGRTMGIGKIKDNYAFYEGYDGEPQITITVKGDEDARIHLWDGYFEDIFGNPPLSENGWSGFTKDYNQLEGAFAAGAGSVEISPVEYLNDISSYKGKTFTYKETSDVVDLICELLRYAIDNGKSVTVTAE